MLLGRAVRRQPAAADRREDEGAAALADEGEPVTSLDRSVPQPKAEPLELEEEAGPIADDSELGKAEELGRRERAFIMLERALLISIFFTQVFAFVHEQFGAVAGLLVDLALFFAVRAILNQELERRDA